jgi:hypothetical protein
MGNRAVIAFDKSAHAPAIYVHWNGGPESVLAFLEVCKQRDYRTPASDKTYAFARLVGVMHEFFDGGLSLGVGQMQSLDVDNDDNGAYLIGGDWSIKERWGNGSDAITDKDQLSRPQVEQYLGIVAKLTSKATP